MHLGFGSQDWLDALSAPVVLTMYYAQVSRDYMLMTKPEAVHLATYWDHLCNEGVFINALFDCPLSATECLATRVTPFVRTAAIMFCCLREIMHFQSEWLLACRCSASVL